MVKHVSVKKSAIQELADFAIEFDDVWACSHYATDIGLQESSKRLNELLKELKDEGTIS